MERCTKGISALRGPSDKKSEQSKNSVSNLFEKEKMINLLEQDDIDLELSIAHYFLWRVAKLKKHVDDIESNTRNTRSTSKKSTSGNKTKKGKKSNKTNGDSTENLTPESLLVKYNSIVKVLKNNLDFILLLRNITSTDIDEYEGIEPDVYSKWQQCKPRNDFIETDAVEQTPPPGTNRRKYTKRKKLNDISLIENEAVDICNIDEDDTSEPPAKCSRLSKTRKSDIVAIEQKDVAELLLLSDDDSDSDSISLKGKVTMNKSDMKLLNNVNRNYKRMKAKYIQLEEKVHRQEEEYLIRQLKMEEETLRKQEKLKKIELLQKEKNEKIKKSIEKLQAERKINKDHYWNSQFEKLVRFQKENGHLRPSAKIRLGKWVCYQRVQYKVKSNYMSQERIEKLNSIGFEFNQRELTSLESRLQDTLQQKDESECKEEDDNIMDWMKDTVEAYVARLELDVSERPRLDNRRYAERLAELAWVLKMGGSINKRKSILSIFPNNTTLVEWVKISRKQIRQFKDGNPSRMTEVRVALLDELGLDIEPRKHWALPCNKNNTLNADGEPIDVDADTSDQPKWKTQLKFCTEDETILTWLNNAVDQYTTRLENDETPKGFNNKRFAMRIAELAWVVETGGSVNDKKAILTIFPNSKNLCHWLKATRTQWKQWKDGKPARMTAIRAALLEEVGIDCNRRMNWNGPAKLYKSCVGEEDENIVEWKKVMVERYMPRLELEETTKCFDNFRFAERVAELAWIVETGGSINEKQSLLTYYPSNPTLPEWVRTIRKEINKFRAGRHSRMSQTRIDILEELGLECNPRKFRGSPRSSKKSRSGSDGGEQITDEINDNDEEEEEYDDDDQSVPDTHTDLAQLPLYSGVEVGYM